MAPETPEKAKIPEQKEKPQEELNLIIQTLEKVAQDMKEYDIKGSTNSGGIIEHKENKEGNKFAYEIKFWTGNYGSGLRINKSKDGFWGRSGIDAIVFKIDKDARTKDWKITMNYEEHSTDSKIVSEKTVAFAEFKKGVYGSDGKDQMIKETANRFLKIITDYIKTNKAKIPGPKEIRNF